MYYLQFWNIQHISKGCSANRFGKLGRSILCRITSLKATFQAMDHPLLNKQLWLQTINQNQENLFASVPSETLKTHWRNIDTNSAHTLLGPCRVRALFTGRTVMVFNQNQENPFVPAPRAWALCHWRGWGLVRGAPLTALSPSNGRFSCVESWPWHKGKPRKQALAPNLDNRLSPQTLITDFRLKTWNWAFAAQPWKQALAPNGFTGFCYNRTLNSTVKLFWC